MEELQLPLPLEIEPMKLEEYTDLMLKEYVPKV